LPPLPRRLSGRGVPVPYAYTPTQLAALLKQHGLQQVLFNAPPGNWDEGERGMACLPGREAEFREGIDKAVEYARVLAARAST
jgi:hydroxypyruvate isomerase